MEESDGGRCIDLNSSGSIGNGVWSEQENVNNWYGATAKIRISTLPTWLQEQNINTGRINGVSNFYIGALSGDTGTFIDLMDQTFVGKGSSSLPTRKVYAESEFDIGLPSVTDYMLSSLNRQCDSMNTATTSTRCATNNFLHKNYDYWTLNADQSSTSSAWAVSKNGSLISNKVTSKLAVRPVIYLKSTTRFSGTGTTSNPYVVK